MSDSANIFVKSCTDLENFVRELEILTGVKLLHYTDQYSEWYGFLDQSVRITLHKHELDNDTDMNFEDYPYQIEVWGIDDMNPVERARRRESYALSLFDKLKSLQKYDLVMWDNLETKLEEYHIG